MGKVTRPCLAAAAVERPRPAGAVAPEALQERLTALFLYAQGLREKVDYFTGVKQKVRAGYT